LNLEVLSEEIGRRLKSARAALVSAESCTGGWVAQVVTATAGSSAWFDRGFVTYTNEAKQELLGVSAETLDRHGAVSEETAREMALGALAHGKGTVSLSVTGIAGPTGGSKEKPVGTVCFAWAEAGRVQSETRRFAGDRESVRKQSVIRALQGLSEFLEAG
jgi:nicotinamide-nucleotide amidase